MAHGGRWTWRRARRVNGALRIDTTLLAAAAIVMVWGWVGLLPARWNAYRSQLAVLKRHPEQELARLGVHKALVIVPEAWSSRIVTNLWGVGAPPGQVESVFGRADSCELHQFAERMRNRKLAPREIADSLAGFVVQSGVFLRPRADWADPAVRLRPGPIPSDCQMEMRRDLDGFTLYGQLAWRNRLGLDSDIVFARDLYQSNTRLFARYRGWQVWRFAPPQGDPKAQPVLTKIMDAAENPTSVEN